MSDALTTLEPGDPAATAFARGAMPFASVMGLIIDSSTPEEVRGRVEWRADFCTVNGNLHGGYLMAVADSMGALLSVHHLPEGAGTSTVSSTTNFLRPAPKGTFTVVSTLVHAGRRTIVVTTDLIDDRDRLVSRTTQTQAVIEAT
jgi:1,4-dihydroxy-2-naphthoyl-CoA hydrolase